MVTAVPGQVVSLVCAAQGRGRPTPTLRFTRDGREVGRATRGRPTNEFLFRASERDNGAEFGCWAENSLGRAESEGTVTVVVVCELMRDSLGEG